VRASAWVAGTVVAGAVLVAVPTSATASSTGQEDPSVRRDGGTLVYADPGLADEDTTRVRGVLRRVVVEPEHGRQHEAETESVVVTQDGVVVPVELDLGEAATSDAPVAADLVDGPALDRALAGRSSAPVEVAQATVQTAEVAPGSTAHRAYVAVVTNSGEGTVASQATIDSRVDLGLSWWVSEADGAVPTFTRPAAQVRFASTQADRCGLSGGSGMTNLWNEAAAKFPGVSFGSSGNHLVVVVDDACSGLGIGTIGQGLTSGGMVTMKEGPDVFASTLVHELGHNLGLRHANYAAWDSTAASTEYRNLYSPMALAVSSPSATYGPPALDSIYRDQLGLEDADEVRRVPSGTTSSVDLAPRGAASGTRAVEVSADGVTYWIDFRAGTDRDATSFYSVPGAELGGRTYPRAVAITRVEPDASRGTRLLAPTSTKGGWTAGSTFTAGTLVISVDEVTASRARVTVANGGALPTVQAGTVTVTGTPQVGSTLTAQPGTWTTGATLSYQWRADGTDVSGATSPTFVPGAAQLGKAMSVQVVGTKTNHLPAAAVSSATAAVAPGVLSGPTPTISGTPRVGNRLTAQPGTWTSGTTLAYLWLVDGAPAGSGTTFTPTAEQRGSTVAVRVTGTKPGYTEASRDSGIATIGSGVLTAPTPTITGTPKVGVRLTASPGTWTAGTTLTYQWFADGTAVTGATAATFTPGAAQRTKRLTVRLTGAKDGYTTTSKASVATAAVAAGTLTSATPRVSGTVRVGRTLSVSRGTWTSGTTFTYQWLANGTAIKGATRSTYTLAKATKGKRISVRVTGRKAGYATVTRTSARTAAVR
jgi:hypothetical protein